jgi:hypothetical protein
LGASWKKSPGFDRRCYELRFDELLTVDDIMALVGASRPTIMRAIRREHDRRAPGEPFEPERFGEHLRKQEDAALAARLLSQGADENGVLAMTGYVHIEAMKAGVRGYWRKKGKKPPLKTRGTVTLQNKGGQPQLVLSGRMLKASGWQVGEDVRWRVEGETIVIRLWTKSERPHVCLTPGDKAGDAYFHHFVEGKSWSETAKLVGFSIHHTIRRAKEFAARYPERCLPTSTRSHDADSGVVKVTGGRRFIGLRLGLAPIRLGWRPGEMAEWEWDAKRRIIIVRKQAQ